MANSSSYRSPWFAKLSAALVWVCLMSVSALNTQAQVLDGKMHHLRGGGTEREWSSFAAEAEAAELSLSFDAKRNDGPVTLWVRQVDVKQAWNLQINGKRIGRLVRDENDLNVAWSVPAKTLKDGGNTLAISMSGKRASDDIKVGQIRIDPRPIDKVLSESKIKVTVTEAGKAVPCRLTIVDSNGSLISLGAKSNDKLAVRHGMIYTADGIVEVGLAIGTYTIYATRGFEYSVASKTVMVGGGGKAVEPLNLSIERQVPTPGLVSCDTHIHTFTYARHGDATLTERMITLAGEGLELPIATDHNIHVDYEAEAQRLKVRQYFTPVIGNEVTTKVGHFNVFPVKKGAKPPDTKPMDWKTIFGNIWATPDVRIVILNHGRDVHGGYRPMGPKHHNALTGRNLDGWKQKANAMEVINSGATQNDPMRLVHDWMGLLNRGHRIAPIGSSDSHDVARYLVGQGRTYVVCPDDDPGKLDVKTAVDSFVAGRVSVSFGLLTEIRVNGKAGPGDLVRANKDIEVSVRVLGPDWINADHVALYANGQKIREATIKLQAKDGKIPIEKWSGKWKIPALKHDVHLVAVAMGPGVTAPYWVVGKPYQPTSPDWTPYVMGVTGAVRIDADGDGKWSSAYSYADRLVKKHGKDFGAMVGALKDFDQATSAQAAHFLVESGVSLHDAKLVQALKDSPAPVRQGFAAFHEAWLQNIGARN